MVKNFQPSEGKGLESVQTPESSETEFHSPSDFLKQLAAYVILCKCFKDCSWYCNQRLMADQSPVDLAFLISMAGKVFKNIN